MRSRSLPRQAPVGRALAQWLAWLPATLAVSAAVPPEPVYRWLAFVLAAALLGAALTVPRRLPPLAVYAAIILAVAAAAVVTRGRWLLPALYLGAAVWRSGLPPRPTAICAAGVATNGIALIAAHWAAGLAPYRPLFIVSGVVWFVLGAYAAHSRLLDTAGLQNGIVTRPVSRSSRAYLTGFIAVVLAVFLATSGFHLWSSVADFLNAHAPKGGPTNPEPPPAAAAPSFWPLPDKGPDHPAPWAKWMERALYGIAGAIAVVSIWWLAKRYLFDRAWLRTLADRLRELLAKLLTRQGPPEKPAYVDERESLLDIGKALRQATVRLWRRGARKPLTLQEWDRLPARDKVRRLYRESVASGMEAGYGFRASDTPAETLAELERWYGRRDGGADSASAGWLRRARRLLAELYGRARYGSREATSGELEELIRDYPWKAPSK
ncbi:DUF4129 domain-containing protein [Cohnella thermotolerans]|uniref:DUF4129 domain-containing protein n=1 Tax=Cohnella thermotolerans TaxID=329858 RepID=UPI0004142C28|nr:DUF4129 domain-containing protein [Cohnella thermotolerans]